MNDTEKKGRLPPATEKEKVLIDDFLCHFRRRLEVSHYRHIEAGRSDKSERMAEQIRYIKNQLSTLNWLIQLNHQRRIDG